MRKLDLDVWWLNHVKLPNSHSGWWNHDVWWFSWWNPKMFDSSPHLPSSTCPFRKVPAPPHAMREDRNDRTESWSRRNVCPAWPRDTQGVTVGIQVAWLHGANVEVSKKLHGNVARTKPGGRRREKNRHKMMMMIMMMMMELAMEMMMMMMIMMTMMIMMIMIMMVMTVVMMVVVMMMMMAVMTMMVIRVVMMVKKMLMIMMMTMMMMMMTMTKKRWWWWWWWWWW